MNIHRLGKSLYHKIISVQTFSEVIAYHDETKNIEGKINGEKTKLNGHILLLVPKKTTIERKYPLFTSKKNTNPRKLLYDKVKEIKDKYNYEGKLHFSKISGKRWGKYNCAEKDIVELCVYALRNKKSEMFKLPLFCKVNVMYYPASKQLHKYGGNHREKKIRYYETLMRILLKNTLNFLYDKNNKVKLVKIISDGKPFHRKLNDNRVLGSVNDLRNYAEIPYETTIKHHSKDHNKFEKDSEEFIDACILQLADMLLGCITLYCFGNSEIPPLELQIGRNKNFDKKSKICSSIKEMLDERKRRYPSEECCYYKSSAVSIALPKNNGWEFKDLIPREKLSKIF